METYTSLLVSLLDNGVLIKAAIKFHDDTPEHDRDDWSVLFCEPAGQAKLRGMVRDHIGLDCPIVDCYEIFDVAKV